MTEQRQVGREKDRQVGFAEQLADEELRKRVEERRSRFVTAARLAHEVHEQRKTTSGLRLRWAGGLVAVLMCVAVLIVGVLTWPESASPPLIDVAEADEFQGVKGIVISSHDRSPIPGVIIKEQFLESNEGSGDFAAITDAMGLFEINPDVEGDRILEFWHDGRKVGTLIVGGETGVSGYIAVPVEVTPDMGCFTYDITLEPGESCDVIEDIVRVSLDTSAEHGWRGKLVHNLKWPSNFVFGLVLAGIFTLDGPECEGLRLEVAVDADIPGWYQFDPQQIKLVSHSEVYEEHDDQWRAHHHQGWYAANKLSDEQIEPFDLERIELEISSGDEEGFKVSWPALAGQQYALLAPVFKDGEVVTCAYFGNVADEDYPFAVMCCINKKFAQQWLYDPIYTPPGSQGHYTKTGFLQISNLLYPLTFNWVENHDVVSGSPLPPLLNQGEFREIPGKLQCDVYDFTLSDRQEYNLESTTLKPMQGNYYINTATGPVGTVSSLRIVGDVKELDQSPCWDFGSDSTVDANGLTADMLTNKTGTYRYRVMLKEKKGPYVLFEDGFTQVDHKYLGYFNWRGFVLPVKQANAEPPEQEVVTRVLSRYAAANPVSNIDSAALHMGPWLFITPPPDWYETPLREIRIWYKTRAASDGACEIPICPHVFLVNFNREQELSVDPVNFTPMICHPLAPSGSNVNLWYAEVGDIDLNAILYYPYCAIVSANDLNSSGSTSEIISENVPITDVTLFWYQQLFGVDLSQLLPDEELVARMRPLVEGPQCGITFSTGEPEEIYSEVDLYGVSLKENEGVLVNYHIIEGNLPVAGQWDVYSGGANPPRIQLVAQDGREITAYFDYSDD